MAKRLSTEGMPVPTNGDTLKSKYSDSRYKLLKVMKRYEQSGGGDSNQGNDEESMVDISN